VNPANQHPAFGAEDQETLAALVPTGESVEEIQDLPEQPTAPATVTTEPPAPAEAATPALAADSQQQAEQATHDQGSVKAALRASRAAERRMRDALAAKDAEIHALREGKAPVSTEVSEADLAQMEQDFPSQAALVRNQRRLEQELAELRAAVKPADWQPPSYAPEIQMHIDEVPELLAWQNDKAQQNKFAAAIEHDKLLETDADWREKPVAERFAEAARRARAQFTPAPVTPATPRNDPAAVIAAAPMATPKGIGDFRGGGPANAPATDFSKMSDEAVMASLPIEG